MPSHFVRRSKVIFHHAHGPIFGLFVPCCHSSDHCGNLLLWYYWHPAYEGQLFGTGHGLSASLIKSVKNSTDVS